MNAFDSFKYLCRKVLKPLLIFALIILGMTCLFFPWAIPLPGRDTLSGAWTGPIHSSEGPAGRLFLTLEPRPSLAAPWTQVTGSKQFNSPAGSRLQGEARLCTRRPLGRIDLAIGGYTTAWSGKTLYILLSPQDPNMKKPRFRMEGRWSGAALEFEQEGNNLDEALGVPGKGGNSPRDWIRAELVKGDENDWLAACEKLDHAP